MATIETKYSVGDKVWFATTTTEKKSHPCPDCKGERKWKAVSPAGEEYSFACPRCAVIYMSNRDLSLDYTAHAPYAARLTIGSVKHDSHPWNSTDNQTSYMCIETGVGSGSVYNEDRLFETEEAALAAAAIMAEKANADTKWIVELYNKTLEMSDYRLEHVLIEQARRAESRASSMIWNIGDLFSKIEEECGSKDEILEAINDYKQFDWARDKEGLAA